VAESTIDAVANRCFLYRGRNAELIGNPSIVHVGEKTRWLAQAPYCRKRYENTKLFSREDSDTKTLGKGSSYLNFRSVDMQSMEK
jgi:hypothetical protein